MFIKKLFTSLILDNKPRPISFSVHKQMHDNRQVKCSACHHKVKADFSQIMRINLMIPASDLIHLHHLHLFLKETRFIILMPKFPLSVVLGNTFSCFLFNRFVVFSE